MEVFILGVAVGVLLMVIVEKLHKIIKRRKALRAYEQLKDRQREQAQSDWSWPEAVEMGWSYVEPTDHPRFRSIKHP